MCRVDTNTTSGEKKSSSTLTSGRFPRPACVQEVADRGVDGKGGRVCAGGFIASFFLLSGECVWSVRRTDDASNETGSLVSRETDSNGNQGMEYSGGDFPFACHVSLCLLVSGFPICKSTCVSVFSETLLEWGRM